MSIDINQQNDEFKLALTKAYRLLGYRARTRKKLRSDLEKNGFTEDTIEQVLQKCEEQNYLNDTDFARYFAQKRLLTHPISRDRLSRELTGHGVVDNEIIDDVLNETFAKHDELEVANMAAAKKRKSIIKLEPVKARQRLASFLQYRGFSWEIIQKVNLWKELSARVDHDR